METIHKFGVRIDGKLHTITGTLTDKQFEEATRDGGLPAGWVAWHVDESECNEPPSARVAELRALPNLLIRWQDALKDAREGRPIGTTGYPVSVL